MGRKSPSNALMLKGKSFGKLTVLERAGRNKNGSALWLCRCECGNTTIANATSLRRGETVSCGCLVAEQIKNAQKVLRIDKVIDGVQVPLLTKKVRSDSRSGHKGVYIRNRNGKIKYEVTIKAKGKRKYLGTFDKLEDAIKARKEGEKEYHQPYIDALAKKERENDKIRKGEYYHVK